MTRTYDVAPDGSVRWSVRYINRDENGNLIGAGRALTERFDSREAAELAAAKLNGK